MTITLPFLGGKPYYRFNTPINDLIYWFVVRWNRRDQAWYFDVLDETEKPIRQGIKVVLGAYLGKSCTDPLFENGVFVVVDTSQQAIAPTFDDLGIRVQIRYLDALDVQALQDGQLV
jgi:hypothetical protein